MKTNNAKSSTKPLLAAFLSLAVSLSGCSMTDTDSGTDSGPDRSHSVPMSGTQTVGAANADTKEVSSGVLDIIAIKGKVSEPGPGVTECGDGKDREKYFRMLHTWSFTPPANTSERLGDVMKKLKEELPQHGWEIMAYEADSSRNKNLNLTADHDKKKFSVNIVHQAKDDPPMLMVRVISGCYQIPEGQEIDRF